LRASDETPEQSVPANILDARHKRAEKGRDKVADGTLFQALTDMSESPVVEVDGRRLKLSNLGKVLYPAAGFTKGQVIDYYARVAPFMVPHLAGRPLTLKRYPNGVDEQYFFEKNATAHRPDWVQTAPIWSGHTRRQIHYILANDLSTVVWMANLAALELHPSLSLATAIQQPTMIVFDLDPGPPADIVQCSQVALWVRDIFAHFGLESFAKTSGSKGLQVYVPLNLPTRYEATKSFARALAQLLEDEHRDLVVSEMKKEVRGGRIFIDWSQNDEHKTTIGVYSLRARENPTVSTPVTWDEVERCLRKKDPKLLVFRAEQVLQRVEEMGDLFVPVLTLKQKLPDLRAMTGPPEPSRVELAAAAQEEGETARKGPAEKTSQKSPAKKRLVKRTARATRK
jgi:bifunctional non-homologous end joining protein LigD